MKMVVQYSLFGVIVEHHPLWRGSLYTINGMRAFVKGGGARRGEGLKIAGGGAEIAGYPSSGG